jgi:putative ABC transport system permease protein
MIRQFFILLWNQRRKNSLLVVEIVLSFVALFVLSAIVIHYYKKYKEPMGMDYKNIWAISIYQDWNLPREQQLNDSVKNIKFEAIKKYLLDEKYISGVAFMTYSDFLYAGNMSSSCFNLNSKQYCYETFRAEPDLAKTTGLKIVEGRWIVPDDMFAKIPSCVINKKFRKELFKNKSAAGKVLTVGDEKNKQQFKIVGVVENLKRHGEFSDEPNFMIEALPERNDYFSWLGMLVRFKGDVPGSYEAKLVNNLVRFDKSFQYRVEKLESMRRQYLMSELAPIIIAGAIVIFLIVNVMLGLFGTLWLNISRRKPEIGLRRAVGSSSGTVLWQILGETYVLAFISMLLGLILTSQIFIFNIYNTPILTLVQANVAAFLTILLLSTISALAPAKVAAALRPAEALHEE